MKESKTKKDPFIVPIVFGVSDFEKEIPLYTWLFEIYLNYAIRNDTALIAQENYFKQEINLLDKYYSVAIEDENQKKVLNDRKKDFLDYSITNKQTEEILNGETSRYKAEVDLLKKENKKLESVIDILLDKIEKDFNRKIDGLMTWVWNPTLEAVAKKKGLKLISLELSPIRKIHANKNYNTTLCFFQFANKYDSFYCKNLYSEFLNSIDKEKIQIFSREELLSMFLNTEDLYLLKEIKRPTQYELGISPSFQGDAFFERYSNEEIDVTCKKINDLLKPEAVSIRYHPNLEYEKGNKGWDKDNSKKSIYWVTKCKRIVSSVSNIAFDAMMFGKTSYVLSENMPFSFKVLNKLEWLDESVVDSLYLNFMVFGYFTHWNLIFDPEYIKWRLSEPNIMEVYKFNRDYVLKLLGINQTEGRLTQKQILERVQNIDEKDIQEIVEYNLYSETEQLEEENRVAQKVIKKQGVEIEEKNQIIQRNVKDLSNIYNSKSWRLTRPMRRFAKALRYLKDRKF